jgi:hypothetical protein
LVMLDHGFPASLALVLHGRRHLLGRGREYRCTVLGEAVLAR